MVEVKSLSGIVGERRQYILTKIRMKNITFPHYYQGKIDFETVSMRYFWGKDQAVLLWGKIKHYFCGEGSSGTFVGKIKQYFSGERSSSTFEGKDQEVMLREEIKQYFWGQDQAVLLWGKIKQYFCGEICRKGEGIMWVQPKRGGAKGPVPWFIPGLSLLPDKTRSKVFSHNGCWVHLIMCCNAIQIVRVQKSQYMVWSIFTFLKKHPWDIGIVLACDLFLDVFIDLPSVLLQYSRTGQSVFEICFNVKHCNICSPSEGTLALGQFGWGPQIHRQSPTVSAKDGHFKSNYSTICISSTSLYSSFYFRLICICICVSTWRMHWR